MKTTLANSSRKTLINVILYSSQNLDEIQVATHFPTSGDSPHGVFKSAKSLQMEPSKPANTSSYGTLMANLSASLFALLFAFPLVFPSTIK